jgi:hypothetical protein
MTDAVVDDFSLLKYAQVQGKISMDRLFTNILEKKGFKITGTIGIGSYAKVK